MKDDPIIVPATTEEREWVRHAALLRGLSVVEYVRRAINASLCREGVDAVLFPERESRRKPLDKDWKRRPTRIGR